jgi:hypothetical protein
MTTKTITFGEEIEFNIPEMPGGKPRNGPPARRQEKRQAPRRRADARPTAPGDAAPPLPDDVKHVRGGTYVVIAGKKAIMVAEGRVILRRSGKSRQWARYLVGRVAGALRTAIEVFLGYPTPEEIRAWLERLPGAEARAALLAWLEKLVERVEPGRLFAAMDLLAGLGRPALLGPAGV